MGTIQRFAPYGLSIAVYLLLLWVLSWGTYRILLARSVAVTTRFAWALLSLLPLVVFVFFHRYHSAFMDERHYWFRDQTNLLPFIAIVVLNNLTNWWFRRRHAVTEASRPDSRWRGP
jgi:hypothetical protein